MKTIFFILLITFYSTNFAQNAEIPIDENTELITWQDVIQIEGDKDKLYKLAIAWINSFFPNPQGATRVRDIENGRIVIHNSIRLYDNLTEGEKVPSSTVVNYVLRLEFRENRYRYTFTDFTMRAASRFPLERWLDTTHQSYQPAWANYLVQVQETVEAIIESMIEGIKEKPIIEDEW